MTNTAILNTSNKNSIKYARENERERERDLNAPNTDQKTDLIDT